MTTLYVTDLDGTLLNSHHEISSRSLEIINGLIGQGMHFTYATARSLFSSLAITKGLTKSIPVIVYNGAFIMNAATKEALYSCYLSKEEQSYGKGLLQAHRMSPLVYSFIDGIEKVSWLPDRENEGTQRYLRLREGDPRLNPVCKEENLYDGNVFYFTCIGEKDDLEPLYHIIKGDGRFTCIFQQELYRPEYWLEIMPKKATKAESIKKLQKIWGCDKVVCFGDALNDIPMFSVSDECYAVKNAVAELKVAANGVIGGNDEDGVAIWLANNYSATNKVL